VSTPDSPRPRQPSISAAILRSQGNRSASVSGLPWRIFSTLESGCSSSPSWNWQPSAAAKRIPTVVLPDPDTPMTTATTGLAIVLASAGDHWRSVRPSLFIFAAFSPLTQDVGLHGLGESIVRIAVGHRTCLRLHFVAGITHGDGKSRLTKHQYVVWHVAESDDFVGRDL